MKLRILIPALMSLVIATPIAAATSPPINWSAFFPGFLDHPRDVQQMLIDRVQQRFDVVDTSGDGRISQEELEEHWPRLADWPELDQYFAMVDTNGDGLTLDEIATAVDNNLFAGLRRMPRR